MSNRIRKTSLLIVSISLVVYCNLHPLAPGFILPVRALTPEVEPGYVKHSPPATSKAARAHRYDSSSPASQKEKNGCLAAAHPLSMAIPISRAIA